MQKSLINKYNEQFTAEHCSEPPGFKVILTYKCVFNLKISSHVINIVTFSGI